MLLDSSSCMKFIILTKGGWGIGVETTSLQKKRENMTNQKVPIVLQADTYIKFFEADLDKFNYAWLPSPLLHLLCCLSLVLINQCYFFLDTMFPTTTPITRPVPYPIRIIFQSNSMRNLES